MLDLIKKIGLIVGVIILGTLVYYFRLDSDSFDLVPDINSDLQIDYQDEVAMVVVHMAGAIMYPGVYELPVGMSVMEAIHFVGGVSSGANLDKVNLAKEIRHGQRIFVPFLKQKEQGVVQSYDKIDINRASRDDLLLIPGIGVTIASHIIRYRDDHGFFKSYDDLLQVKYIGKGMLTKIRPYIMLDK